MNQEGDLAYSIRIARQISSDLVEFAENHEPPAVGTLGIADSTRLPPADPVLVNFDRRILDPDLRAATRSRFATMHYADSVEAGVKALNECVRARTGRSEDGDALMTIAFSPNGALLRINKGRSKSDESAQRGHMLLCQGIVGAWRNPRAHTNLADTPERALMMLETINDLIGITKTATRTRKRKKP